MVETKTAQYVHDIDLHFTEKEKKDTNKKIKKISIEIKRMYGCEIYCKLTRNKHGIVTRLTC